MEFSSIFRFVGNIGDTYGSALLLHMLTSTVTLTLLAYQATKVRKAAIFIMLPTRNYYTYILGLFTYYDYITSIFVFREIRTEKSGWMRRVE
jgi:hypothetical protein